MSLCTWLILFLSILFFLCYSKLYCFLNFIFRFLIVIIWKNNEIFLCLFCVLQLSWICLFVLMGFFVLFRFVESLWFSTYKIMSSINRDNFTSFLFECFYFFFLLWLEFFSTILNWCKSGHPCLVPDLKGKYFSFSLSMMLAVG